MATTRKDTVETQSDDGGVTSTTVNQSSRSNPGFKLEQIVYLITGITELLLLIRLVLTMLGANKENEFASFIYSITYPIVAPFFGLFNNTFSYGVARIEVETLVAMLVVSLVGWVIGSLLAIIRK